MITPHEFPRYAREQSYDWNFAHAPQALPDVDIRPMTGSWTYCGLPVASPLGIAAGPLLNGDWLTYYARLGFDILTYKTVRSVARDCFDLPNLVPVEVQEMSEQTDVVTISEDWRGSWAVSFGMPSKLPEFWQPDVSRAKRQLQPGQLLSVSVVGTMQDGWALDDLARDYAECALQAFESGADCVEMNFSCPNVCSQDGQLFQNAADAARVAGCVRVAVGPGRPLLVKMGYLHGDRDLLDVLSQLSEHVDAVVATNSLPAKVAAPTGTILFDGRQRGICGRCTRDASVDLVRRCKKLIDREQLQLTVIGVGGIETAADVRRYLDAGAEAVQLATAVMIDPLVGLNIRKNWGQ